MRIDMPSFMVGFLAAGVAGFILGKIQRWNREIWSIRRPMSVSTKGTPADAVKKSCLAVITLFLWLFVLGVYLLLMLYLLFVWPR